MSNAYSAPDFHAPTPHALMAGLLLGLERRMPADQVDELWVFPTRKSGLMESCLLVVSAFEEDGGRRLILTVRGVARKDASGKVEVTQELVEQGVAPADRVVRLLEGVLRRLDDALTAEPPRTFEIGGEPERWRDAVRSLTGAAEARMQDDAATDPRSGEDSE
ncbi:MAG TPA: hypothetical protein VMK65_10490 [Longimicrobiales bacterium]|nr:hypothetical protein [Longimicrobiales bacterium]